MTHMQAAQVARWVRSHGHVATVDGESVHVKVEWFDVNTGSAGVDTIVCRDMSEARAALGY